MIRIFLGLILLAAFAGPVQAAHNRTCDDHAPYYHSTMPNSIGARLADVFFFPFTVAVTALTTPAVVATPRNRRGARVSVTANAACMPVSLARHFAGGRPMPKHGDD